MSRWSRWTTGESRFSLDKFLQEQQSPAEMAQSMGLQSDGSGGYIDPNTGQVVARTVNGELVFYDSMGGAISAQSGGAQLTQDQPSWVDPVTGELTTPPGKPESPEEISAIPDPIPAQAPAGYSAFMNKKKEMAYKQQTTPVDAVDNLEAQEENPEMGFPEKGVQEDYSPAGMANTISKRNKFKPQPITAQQRVNQNRTVDTENGMMGDMKTQQADVDTPESKGVERQDVRQGAVAQEPKKLDLKKPVEPETVDTEQVDDEEMEAIQDDRERYLKDYDKVVGDYRGQLTGLSDLQNKNADKRFGALRDSIGKIDDPNKRKAFMNAITLAYGYTGRVNSGAGKNALGKVDHELLQQNRDRLVNGYGDGSAENIKDFVESTRIMDVSDQETEAFFDALPPKLQSYFMGAGKIAENYDGHYLGMNPDGSAIRGRLTGKSNGMANGRLRGLTVAKLLLQQGGKDGYTGTDLDLNATDLEHVRGFNNMDEGAPTQEMKDLRENIDNFILTSSNLNQTKVDKNMGEWYDSEIDKLNDFSEDDFNNRDELMNQSNTINDKAGLVNQLFLDEEGNLSENATGEMYDMYSRNDRQLAKSINTQIGKFAKEKGINLPKVKNRIGYEMIKKLGLGGYMTKKSGRGNQSKLDDKIYSAFISTLMDQDEEGRERLSNVWKEGRAKGSQAAFDQQNDGAAKTELIKHLRENGGIADRFFEDKEFKRILKEFTDITALFKDMGML